LENGRKQNERPTTILCFGNINWSNFNRDTQFAFKNNSMSEPTPETDAKASPHIGFYSCATVPANFARALERERDEAREALTDMLSGWKYIRQVHGDLYGVGWDRAQTKAEKVLE
jgi:hypothetical protein